MIKLIWIISITVFIVKACSKEECPVVGNKLTGIFHIKGCPNYQRMLEKNEGYDNRACFKDQKEAHANGYQKAGNCLR